MTTPDGTLILDSTGVLSGTYANPTLTINDSGQIVAIFGTAAASQGSPTAANTSGTWGFMPTGGDLAIDAYGRIGIRPSAITTEHMMQARLSVNIMTLDWGNRGVNLWEVDLQGIQLIQGVSQYIIPANTVQVLDSYIRLPSMGQAVSIAPVFTTQSGNPTVQITWSNNGLTSGSFVTVVVPVAVGGLVIQGTYTVLSVIDNNNFTITASGGAQATVTGGGAVPIFTTQAGSGTVSVSLPDHGLFSGQVFTVQAQTTVGGLTLLGAYTVASVTDVNTFTFNAGPTLTAGSNDTKSENGGLTQISGQVPNAQPVDLWQSPISRTEWAQLPNKFEQGRPTSYWFDRLTGTPTLNIWPVPDASGPYMFYFYRMRDIQDTNLVETQTPDAPRRFLRAFVSELAYELGIKYPPDPKTGRDLNFLMRDKDISWASASAEDRERVPLRLQPDFSSYFR